MRSIKYRAKAMSGEWVYGNFIHSNVSGSALFNADCMDILPLIPDKSVQLILADLP